MKFQAAAMGRADMAEDQRVDFSLYVDEFQNFATESFESILSEARKYRLNLILGNQFMTQLTDKIREAIIGNVGTVVSGRIGITDAEILVKKFAPTFDAEDLTKMPNYQSVTSVMINNVPSAPFSMSFLPPMGQSNSQLRDALKRLSAAKYGKPRAQVEKDIFTRLGSAEAEKKAKAEAARKTQAQRMTAPTKPSSSSSSFLDEWLSKRKQISEPKSAPSPLTAPKPQSVQQPAAIPPAASMPSQQPQQPVTTAPNPFLPPQQSAAPTIPTPPAQEVPKAPENSLHLRGDRENRDSEVSIKLR